MDIELAGIIISATGVTVSLIVALVAIKNSREALAKSAEAINVQRANSTIPMLQGLLQEIDEWTGTQYAYVNGLSDDQSEREKWFKYFESIIKFYDQLEKNHAIIVGSLIQGREIQFRLSQMDLTHDRLATEPQDPIVWKQKKDEQVDWEQFKEACYEEFGFVVGKLRPYVQMKLDERQGLLLGSE